MRIPWYLNALCAALIWGIHYPLVDHALRKVSLVAVLLLTALPIVLIAPFFHKTLAADYQALRHMGWGVKGPILALALTSLLGSVLLFLSIHGKNATLASLIEITYPLFVALFAWLLFRHVHFDLTVVVGAMLILAGAGLIILSNP